jgi:hypothetical protein
MKAMIAGDKPLRAKLLKDFSSKARYARLPVALSKGLRSASAPTLISPYCVHDQRRKVVARIVSPDASAPGSWLR